jgi:type IV pilus assembly protein PilQ
MANSLENIAFSSMPGDKIQIKMEFTEQAPDPKIFTIDVPARIVLDFKDTDLKLNKKKQTIGVGMARSIKAVESQGRTRVVVNLTSLTEYKTKTKDNILYLTLNKTNTTGNKYASKQSVRDIDFKRGSKGEGHIIINFNENIENITLKDEGGKNHC